METKHNLVITTQQSDISETVNLNIDRAPGVTKRDLTIWHTHKKLNH